MDFIKRNLGFVLFILAVVVGLGVLAFFYMGMHRELVAISTKVDEQKDFLLQVQRGAYSFNGPNKQKAAENRELSVRELQAFLTDLNGRYGFALDAVNSYGIKNYIRDGLLRLQGDMNAKGMKMGIEPQNFSFEGVLKMESLPPENDVPLIVRQFKLVDEVARLVLKTPGMNELQRVARVKPGLQAMDYPQYSLITLDIGVSGSYPAIIQLVNQLQRESKGFFIVRSIELQSKDQAAGIGGARTAERGGGAGLRGNVPPPHPGDRRVLPGGEPAGAGTGDKSGASKNILDLPKEQRVVFMPHDVQASLIVDYIEFKKPAEEK